MPIDFVNETGIETVSWEWDFGDPSSGADNQSNLENPSHIYSTIGDYTVTFYTESPEGCRDTSTLDFTIYPEFLSDVGADLEICFGSSVTLNADTDEPSTPYSYIWSPSASLDDPSLQNPTLTVDYEGPRNYTVEVRDPNGCLHSDKMQAFGLSLPEVSVPENFTICYGEEIPLEGVVGNNVVSFEWWNETEMVSDTQLSPMMSPEVTTTYTLNVVDDKGCENSTEVTIDVVPAIVLTATPDTSMCYNESIQLSAFSAGAESYVWTPALSLDNPNSPNPTASPSVTTEYIVTGVNSCFSNVRDTVLVTVIPEPVVDAGESITIGIGETATLNASGEWAFNWLPNSDLSSTAIPNPNVTPLETTTYYVVTTDQFGCQSIDSVQVIVDNIFEVVMPNAFSPNRDGVNDVFSIGPTRGLAEVLEFKIFTRWGQEVFSTTDVTKGWNGEVDFRPMGIGTYVYYVRALTLLNEELTWKGNLTLIR